MTTIAANRREMCADSCVSWDSSFVLADDKIQAINGQLVGCAGHSPSIDKFIHWMKNPVAEHPDFDADDEKSFDALMLNDKGLWLFSNSCTPARLLNGYFAIGSGGQSATTAMMCGKAPRTEVEMACLVDKNTKGPVHRRTLRQANKRKV
jgi:hypothetical protein